MAGTLSSSGTWTTQLTTFPAATGPNVPKLDSVNPEDLRSVPTEVDQMIKLVASAYSTGYWAAAVWLRAQLTNVCNRQAPVT